MPPGSAELMSGGGGLFPPSLFYGPIIVEPFQAVTVIHAHANTLHLALRRPDLNPEHPKGFFDAKPVASRGFLSVGLCDRGPEPVPGGRVRCHAAAIGRL